MKHDESAYGMKKAKKSRKRLVSEIDDLTEHDVPAVLYPRAKRPRLDESDDVAVLLTPTPSEEVTAHSDADESDSGNQQALFDGACPLHYPSLGNAHVVSGVALLLEAADDVEREESSMDMSVQSTPLQSPTSVDMVPPFAYNYAERMPEYMKHAYPVSFAYPYY